MTRRSFLPPNDAQVPAGHAVAEATGCFDHRSLFITVDFASRPVPRGLLSEANAVLASLKVRRA
jgi:hypothetical protein